MLLPIADLLRIADPFADPIADPERTAGRGVSPGPQHPLVVQSGATMSCSTSHSVISREVSIIWPAASVLPLVASTT